MKRARLFDISQIIQVTAIKDTSEEKGLDCIKLITYGYTTEGDYLEFQFCLEYESEQIRDEEFDDLTTEHVKESIETIVKESQIPMQLI
ncbi:hypothetical protein [uncultured Flavobacterium sp.]|uniref:hypothetical protein n=1 Tax=uncultured Flavobacterium sp. TaxID=165435 RepID=UPI0025E69F60|nr:hypothetical protein [uncultured Flavobacterium sp.]